MMCMQHTPVQFAYNRSKGDPSCFMALEHRWTITKGSTRLLSVDYSLAFDTLIPSQLITKLLNLGIRKSLNDRILDFLIARPRRVQINSNLSSTLILDTDRSPTRHHAEPAAVFWMWLVCGHLSVSPICRSSPNCYRKVGSARQ